MKMKLLLLIAALFIIPTAIEARKGYKLDEFRNIRYGGSFYRDSMD